MRNPSLILSVYFHLQVILIVIFIFCAKSSQIYKIFPIGTEHTGESANRKRHKLNFNLKILNCKHILGAHLRSLKIFQQQWRRVRIAFTVFIYFTLSNFTSIRSNSRTSVVAIRKLNWMYVHMHLQNNCNKKAMWRSMRIRTHSSKRVNFSCAIVRITVQL